MTTVERLSITLPADMARLIRAKVEEGRYASNSEVIREALRTWQAQEQLRAERLGNMGDRIYTLTATAADAAGNISTVSSTCAVPHDQGK